MHKQEPFTLPARQKGIVLLVIIIAIIMAFAAYMFSDISINQVKTNNKEITVQALKKAKDALLAYAVSFPEITLADRGPGYLPCPDLDNNGKSTANDCKTLGVPNVGRLPWVTLGIDKLVDGTGESLWYAVSENYDYSNSPTINKINTGTTGNITVRDQSNTIIYNGTTIDAAVVVIIAPGKAITRDDGTVQNRSAANVNVAAHYLDIADTQDNATFQQSDANDGFIQGEILDAAGNVIVNDQIMVITYDDIMEQVHKRVAQEIGNALNSYKTACGGYPEASSFDSTKGNGLFISDPGVLEGHIPVDSPDWGPPNPPANPTPCADGVLPSWVEAEEWHKVTYYEYAASTPCDTANCLSVPPDINIDALIVFAGRDTTGGNRDSALTSDYFEGENDDSNPTSDELIYDDTQAEDYVWVIAP